VAAIHTNILKTQELADFFHVYPEKFNNKTNGITQRRWLAHCNPRLSELITKEIGSGWLKDLDELTKLKPLAKDPAFCEKFSKVKHDNKVDLSNYFFERYSVKVDPDSVFDVQVKRLHEYKRQLLNIFHVIDMYNTLNLILTWKCLRARLFSALRLMLITIALS
jgi:starch phosphorylase